MSANSRQREGWLDSLKGFAILLVILGHVLSGYLDAWMFPGSFWSIYITRTWIYAFHMPLFFLLSGFTFTLAYWSDGSLRHNRYLRQLFSIAWLYTLYVLLQWCIKAAVPGLVNEAYTLEDLKNIFVEPLGNFWYLYVLFIFYLAAALLRLPRLHSLWLLFFGGASIVVLAMHLNWYRLTQYRIVYHFFFFMLGSVLCRNRDKLGSAKLFGICTLFMVNVLSFYLAYYPRSWYANWSFMIALALCYILVWLFYRLPKLAAFPLFRICGKYSLELYLLHTFFTAGLRSLLTWAGITTAWLHAGINFILSTAVCLTLAIVIGKTPLSYVLFKPGKLYDRLMPKLLGRVSRRGPHT